MSWAIKRQVDEVASYDLTSYLLLLVKNSNLKAIVVSQQRQKNKFWIFEHRHRHFAQFKNGWETRPGGKFQPQSNVSLVSSYGMGGTERNGKWPHLLGNKLTRYGQKKIKTLTKLARAFHSRLFIPISRHQLNALEDKIQFNQQFVLAI